STATISSFTTESTSHDTEILPFIWDEIAFKNAQDLLEINDDEINWEDADFEENFETESVITKFTEEDINYQIENISGSLNLTPCVIIDIID
ncbi:3941_t:CDS:1, partial [Funneliformis mosseae]